MITVVKWTAFAAVAAFAIVVAINAFDEAPTAEAVALAEPPPAIPATDNAYFAFLGFDAPAGTDPAKEGKRQVAEHDAIARSNPWGMPDPASLARNLETAESGARLKYVGSGMTACGQFGTDAPAQALAHASELRQAHRANDVLAERFVAMHKLSGFAVTALPSVLQPMQGDGWARMQRILLCEAIVDAQSGRAAQALSFIGDDLQFLRRMLAGNGNLLTEMLATAFAARDLHALSSLIATPGFPAEPNAAALRAMLTPLEMPGAGMARALASEHAMQVALLQQLPTMPEPPPPDDETLAEKFERLVWPRWLERRFYRPQATLNLSAKSFDQLIALANEHPVEFLAERDRLRARFAKTSSFRADMLYNPVGKMLVEIARPNYDDYIARVFDLAAYINLVRARLEIRLAAVPPDQVPSFLADAGKETRNPYDGKPFAWDPATRMLTFTPRSQRWRDWITSEPVATGAPAR